MEAFFKKLRPIAAFIGLGCLAMFLILDLVANIGAIADGGSGSIMFAWTIELLLVGGLGFAFFAKRKELARALLVVLLAFYVVSISLGRDYSTYSVYADIDNNPLVAATPLLIPAAVFAFSALVLVLLGFALARIFARPLFGFITVGAMAAFVFFTLIAFLLAMIGMGKANADYGEVFQWHAFVGAVGELLFLPVAGLFGTLCYVVKVEE